MGVRRGVDSSGFGGRFPTWVVPCRSCDLNTVVPAAACGRIPPGPVRADGSRWCCRSRWWRQCQFQMRLLRGCSVSTVAGRGRLHLSSAAPATPCTRRSCWGARSPGCRKRDQHIGRASRAAPALLRSAGTWRSCVAGVLERRCVGVVRGLVLVRDRQIGDHDAACGTVT